jgi:hypothetical protein
MIRKIVRAEDTNLTINIPENYVGKNIEYIIFPLENETHHKEDELKSISSLKGILNKYADPSKVELEDQAWKLHVQKKYKING